MYKYFKAEETSKEKIYEAFQKGFSDYIIRFEMTQEEFFSRLFGSDGNEMSCSYVAFQGENPIGLVLGGIKQFGGVKTMRCGTLCIDPPHRGQGVSDALFSLHEMNAIENGCSQLFLEVIKGNDRAISFYEKKGYIKIYDMKYYSMKKKDLGYAPQNRRSDYSIREISYGDLIGLEKFLKDVHLNWQTDFKAMRKIEGIKYIGLYHREELIGTSAYRDSGKIFFIWVEPEARLQSAGTSILDYIAKDVSSEALYISFSNHMGLSGFVRKKGFIEDDLSQHEMVKLL